MDLYLTLVIDSLILIFELVLYYKISKLLKEQLHFYYQKKKKDLLILTIVSILFFIIQIILKLPIKYFNSKADIMIYLNNFKIDKREFTVLEFVFVMVIDIAAYAPLFFHVYFNIRNINFKVYLREVLKGYCLEHKYRISSGFIYVKERSNNLCDLKTTNNESSGNLESDSLLENILQSANSESSESRDKFKEDFLRIKNHNVLSSRYMNSRDTDL